MNLKKLNQAGYKLTLPRKIILAILENSDRPLSAREIYLQAKKINLASVYRSLKIFQRIKIVQEESIGEEKYYYLSSIQHHHIICEKCGSWECVPCRHNFQVKNFRQIKHSLILTGLCHKC